MLEGSVCEVHGWVLDEAMKGMVGKAMEKLERLADAYAAVSCSGLGARGGRFHTWVISLQGE